MRKAIVVLLVFVAILVLATMVATASTGSNTSAAPAPQAGTPAASAATSKPVSSAISDSGSEHQAYYNQLYQDGVIQVSDITYAFKANPDTTTVTFKLLKNGQPIDPKLRWTTLSIYWVPFKDGKFQFEPAADRLSLKGKITVGRQGHGHQHADRAGEGRQGLRRLHRREQDRRSCWWSTAAMGRSGPSRAPRVAQNKYPFAGLLQTGTVSTTSRRPMIAGCVKCHTDPYLKHGYIYGRSTATRRPTS